jgi:hypothetical protein
MTLHLDHFALTIEPFAKDIADQDLWLPPSKRSLLDAVEARRMSSSPASPVRAPCLFALFATRRRPSVFA